MNVWRNQSSDRSTRNKIDLFFLPRIDVIVPWRWIIARISSKLLFRMNHYQQDCNEIKLLKMESGRSWVVGSVNVSDFGLRRKKNNVEVSQSNDHMNIRVLHFEGCYILDAVCINITQSIWKSQGDDQWMELMLFDEILFHCLSLCR